LLFTEWVIDGAADGPVFDLREKMDVYNGGFFKLK
jgi:hypothetical protein